jgi:4-amino-4-deoxy-L-arabinose transferase-like glycosyltransferase
VANTWDSRFYHETATSLAGGEGYTFQGKPTALWPPAFSAVLSAVYRITGPDPRAGQLLNVLLSLALLAAIVDLTRTLAGGRAAFLAAILLALEPSQIVMPAFLMSEVLCGAAVAGALACAARGARGGGAWTWGALLLGVGAGFARGHAFLVLPAALLALRGWPRPPGRRWLATFALVVAGLGLSVALWAMRNDRLLGKPVLLSTNTGINLLLGNNPNATGGRADPPQPLPETGDEVLDEEIAIRRALEHVREDPWRTVGLLPLKAARLLGAGPAVTYRAETREKWGPGAALVMVLAQVSHAALFALAGLFLWRARRGTRQPGERVLGRVVAVVALLWTLGHLPFLGGARYLFPVHALLAAAAAAFLAGIRPGLSETST